MSLGEVLKKVLDLQDKTDMKDI